MAKSETVGELILRLFPHGFGQQIVNFLLVSGRSEEAIQVIRNVIDAEEDFGQVIASIETNRGKDRLFPP